MGRRLFASLVLLVSSLAFDSSSGFSLSSLPAGRVPSVSSLTRPAQLTLRSRIHTPTTQQVQQKQQSGPLSLKWTTAVFCRQSTILILQAANEPKGDNGEDDPCDSEEPHRLVPQQKKRRPSRIRRFVRRVLVAVGFWFAWQRAPPAAHAKFSYEIRENPTVSIRPGMNQEQAELVQTTGEIPSTSSTPTTATGSGSSGSGITTTTRSKAKTTTSKKSSSVYGEYDDDEDDDALLEEDDVISPFYSKTTSSESTVGNQADRALAARLAAKTSSSFASYQQRSAGGSRSVVLTTQVALALFVPTFGGMFVREFLRRRREEEYVRKGLEILEAQKAEYFNVTSTTADSDVQDALKGLKNSKNQTKAGDDDDDDDDDDEDDDDEEDDKPQDRRRRPPPRPPTSPKDDGGSGTGGAPRADGGDDPGYGKASDEDIDKLNRLMGRS